MTPFRAIPVPRSLVPSERRRNRENAGATDTAWRRLFSVAVTALAMSVVAVRAAEAPTPEDAAAAVRPEPRVAPPDPDLTAPDNEIPDWRVRWELARVLGYAKRYDESIAEYERLLKEKPDLTAARIEMAAVHFWSGRVDDARKLLEDVDWDAVDPELRMQGVDVLLSAKRYERAEAVLRKQIEEDATHRGARKRLAALLSWTKRYPESLALYEDLLKETPDDTGLRRKYGFVLIWAGRLDDGAKELRATLPENRPETAEEAGR